MTDEEKIKQVLYQFEDGGLISKDIEQALDCFSEPLLGMGLGEQGFVKSKKDIREVVENSIKQNDHSAYSLEYGRIEVLIHKGIFASVCAEVTVIAHRSEQCPKQLSSVLKSSFQQSLTLIKEQEEWKVCGLHASTPIVTEEALEAYPLNFAEKTLQGLREKIGEEIYLAEEQYRQAVLADTIGFYIINFTRDIFEKCQLNNDWCIYVDPGNPYEQFLTEKAPHYIAKQDQEMFLKQFSSENIHRAFHSNETELTCEYQMHLQNGSFVWVRSILRLLIDVVTGEQKGIMYVKNIDESKRQEIAILNRAAIDDMTEVYNKGTLIDRINSLLPEAGGVFIMLDVDDFKAINDTYGHPVGDQVLIAIAQVLKHIFEEIGLVGRLGGDEFGVFMPGKNTTENLREKLQCLLEEINRIKISDAGMLMVSCSIGVACCDADALFTDIYKRADSALYQSKKRGKNQISYL